jgi:hypothetical protein
MSFFNSVPSFFLIIVLAFVVAAGVFSILIASDGFDEFVYKRLVGNFGWTISRLPGSHGDIWAFKGSGNEDLRPMKKLQGTAEKLAMESAPGSKTYACLFPDRGNWIANLVIADGAETRFFHGKGPSDFSAVHELKEKVASKSAFHRMSGDLRSRRAQVICCHRKHCPFSAECARRRFWNGALPDEES